MCVIFQSMQQPARYTTCACVWIFAIPHVLSSKCTSLHFVRRAPISIGSELIPPNTQRPPPLPPDELVEV